jgi:2-dehydropantoate 2-reductase
MGFPYFYLISTETGEKSMNDAVRNIKRICVYGVGGVGGFFAGKIVTKLVENQDNNYEVYVVARGEHLQQIKRHGLILKTPGGDTLTCKPDLAVKSLSETPGADLIIVCVKSYDLPAAVRDITDKAADKTVVLPLLNGVDIYERIRETLKTGIVLPACVYLSSVVEGPGVISHKGGNGLVIFGKDPVYPEFVPAWITEFFDYTGVNYTWADNSFPSIWEKYIFIASFALVTAYAGKTIGEVMADPKLTGEVKMIMEEVLSLAELEGIELRKSIVEESLSKANNFAFDTKTSYQRDIEQRNKNNEGDLFGGTIIRLGTKHGIPTRVTERIYSLITNTI